MARFSHPLNETYSVKRKKSLLSMSKDPNQYVFDIKMRNDLQIMYFWGRYYCESFITLINEAKKDYAAIGISVDNALPFPFNTEKVPSFGVIYSVTRKQVLIVFGETIGDDRFNGYFFRPVYGNPHDYFGYIPGFSGVDLQSLDIELPIPRTEVFEFPSETIEMNYYTLIMPNWIFFLKLREMKNVVRNFISVHWGNYKYSLSNNRNTYLQELERLKHDMGKLFFDETVGELKIDKFIENNSLILECGLSLEKLNHQVRLENVLGKYASDLKPDVIAYDNIEKNWAIVDYKKAKSSIIKNLKKTRTGFRSDVNNLEDQLLDYVEYFEEEAHREFVENKYGLKIMNPNAIGIIGRINEEEREAFIRLMKKKQRWFRVVPYNYLYENFCKHLEQARQHLRGDLM